MKPTSPGQRMIHKIRKEHIMREEHRIGRRGLYEIITTFVVVIFIVFAVIGFIALYSVVFKTQGSNAKRSDELSIAKNFYTYLLSKHSRSSLYAPILDAGCISYDGVAGYTIEQQALYNCTARHWQCGTTPDLTSRTTYWTVIQQADSSTCLAKISMYIK